MHYDWKAKPRRLEEGDRVLILLPTDSNKLLMQWRGPYTVESRVGANDYCKTLYFRVPFIFASFAFVLLTQI